MKDEWLERILGETNLTDYPAQNLSLIFHGIRRATNFPRN